MNEMAGVKISREAATLFEPPWSFAPNTRALEPPGLPRLWLPLNVLDMRETIVRDVHKSNMVPCAIMDLCGPQ